MFQSVFVWNKPGKNISRYTAVTAISLIHYDVKVAKLTGTTARTLHYYDEIGLLKPTEVTEAGYFISASYFSISLLSKTSKFIAVTPFF